MKKVYQAPEVIEVLKWQDELLLNTSGEAGGENNNGILDVDLGNWFS